MAAEQGIGWATWIALLGVLVNLIFNTINFFSNRKTRRNTLQLENFSTHVREPITNALSALDAIMDEADDIARSTQPYVEKLAAVADLSKKFHAARRILARLLNDCDKSPLIRGNDWSRCDEGHMDDATEAFEACRSVDDGDLHSQLHKIAMAINSLRSQLQSQLDAEAQRLMG
jgi:hypothetical protein